MKRNMDYGKLEQNLKQLRFPDRVPALSFNPQEPPRAILIRNNLLALAAGIACLALVVGLALWSHHWKSEIQAPPVSDTPSATEPSGETEPPFESDSTESTEESSQVEESAVESSPSQEDPVIFAASTVLVPVESIPGSVTITPLSFTRWEDNGQNEKASFGRVLRTEEELRSFLTPLCSREQDPNHEPAFLSLNEQSNQYFFSDFDRTPVESVVSAHQSIFKEEQVLVGVYTYYPTAVLETIDSIQVEGNKLTVRMAADDCPYEYPYHPTNRITTLIAIPDYTVRDVDQVEVVTHCEGTVLLAPDPPLQPEQEYDLFEVYNWNFQDGLDRFVQFITSLEDFEQWIDDTLTLYPDDQKRLLFAQETDSTTSTAPPLEKAALLEQYQPWLEQGGTLVVMAYHNLTIGLPYHFHKVVREENRLVLQFYYYIYKDVPVILPVVNDWLFILPMEGDATQGVTQAEFNLTGYYVPWP